ncbi:MAG: hypothetical protein LBH93_08090 [Chitinispirillales bacterium]|jgi:hypothetical protein|nr:hypothetical protein [Chitinispirillales bacterium]
MENAQKFDIFAVSVPDYKAQEAVARIISANSYVPMHTAMEKAKATPALLFHNIELNDAGHHIAELKALGVGFRVERQEEPVAEAQSGTAKPNEPAHAGIEPPEAEAEAQPAAADSGADPLAPGGEAEPQPVLSDILTAADTSEPASKPALKPELKRERERERKQEPEPRRLPAHDELHYRKHSEGGVRIEGVGIDAIRKSEEKTRKKSIMISAIVFAGIIVLGSVIAFLPPKYTFSASNAPAAPAKPGGKADAKPGGKKQADKSGKRDARAAANSAAAAGSAGATGKQEQRAPSGDQLRVQVGGAQKQQSNAYVDSAKSLHINQQGSVALYKIAISFNRYNLQAWHGLLQAYKSMGNLEEARKTEAQMREVFGENVNSVSAAVSQFGELSDAYMSASETYRVEYRSKKASRDDVLREVFNMTRAVRNACRCQNVSIHAYAASGKEMIAHSTEKASIHSLSEFSNNAEIFWLE